MKNESGVEKIESDARSEGTLKLVMTSMFADRGPKISKPVLRQLLGK